MKGSIQIEGEVNTKVDNVVCMRPPEHVALRRDNREHTLSHKRQLESATLRARVTRGVLEYQISSNRLAWTSLIQRSPVVSYSASELFFRAFPQL